MNNKFKVFLHYFVLFAMLFNTVIVPAQEFAIAYKKALYTIKSQGNLYLPTQENNIPKTESNYSYKTNTSSVRSEHVLPSTPSSFANKNNDVEIINSDLSEGIIGTSKKVPLDNPVDNVFIFSIENKIGSNDIVVLKYDLFGLETSDGVAKSINERDAKGGHLIKINNSWSTQEELINNEWVNQGENHILFTIPEGVSYQYKVRNVHLEVKKNSTLYSSLNLYKKDIKYIKNNKAYIRGFCKNLSNDNIYIDIEGQQVKPSSGEFEAFVELNDFIKNKKFITVRAYDSNGSLGQEIVFLDPKLEEVDSFVDLKDSKIFEKKVINPYQSSILSIEGASIEVVDSALTSQTEIAIKSLRKVDFAPLGSDLTNVTLGNTAYRFLPDGTTFEKPIKITLAYDPKLLPFGYSAKDIKTYFFDIKSKSWKSVAVVGFDEKNHTITAMTTHFTDYINGIIKVPESPETNAYTPTTISGIKIANPGEKINLIQPPTANQQGDANLSYPIEIPAGRAGMQPNLAVTYNSSSSGGWMGLGWNISTPSIDIDSRWGTPTFDAATESEIYTFEGEQLLLKNNTTFYLANKTNPITRVSNALFFERVEGAFNKIQRMGTSPSNYYWIVTDKSGTKFTYGTQDAILTTGIGTSGNIAKWMLKKVEDVNGNYFEYFYTTKSFASGTTSNGKQIYLQRIEYTKHSSLAFPYSIVFNRSTSVPTSSGSFIREDKRIDARLGFKEITDDVLESIEVKYQASIVRKYKFLYKQGVFKRTLLEKIQQYDGVGVLFNEHVLEYYDDTNNGQNLFGPEENFQNLATDVGGVQALNSTNLGASHVTSYGGTLGVTGGYASIANPSTLNIFSQAGTGGIFGGLSGSDSKGKITFTDIDGDGLPDKLMQLGGGLSYRKNLGNNTLSNPKSIFGIDEFSRSTSTTNSLGLRASFVIFAGLERSWTKSYTDSYIEDVNGDGLLDIVKDRKVYFNTLRPLSGDILPQFNDQSSASPNVIYQDLSFVPAAPSLNTPTVQNYIYDIVKVWEAPYSGTISISGTVGLNSSTSTDGIRFSIEKGNVTEASPTPSGAYNTLLPAYPTNITGSAIHTINATSVSVAKGQRIYFRINSIANDINDLVNFNPSILYTSAVSTSNTLANSLQVNADGLSFLESNANDGFITSSPQRIVAPYPGTYSISWPSLSFNNPQPTTSSSINLSDEVEFIVTKHLKTTNGSTVTESSTILQSSRIKVYNTGIQTLSANAGLANISILPTEIDNDNSDNITSDVSFSFSVKSNSNIDWKFVDNWTPSFVIPNSAAGVNDGRTILVVPSSTIYNSIKTSNTFVVPPTLPTSGATPSTYNMQPVFPLSGTTPNFGVCSTCPTSGVRDLYISVKGSVKNLLFHGTTFPGTLALQQANLAKYKISINNSGAITAINRYNYTTGTYSTAITPLVSTSINVIFQAHNNTALPTTIKNDRVYFEYYTEFEDIANSVANVNGGAARLKISSASWIATLPSSQSIKPNIYVVKGNNDFGPKYRGWGQFAYKTEYSGSTVLALKESELIPDNSAVSPTQAQIDACYNNYPNDDAGFQACIESLSPQKRIYVLIPSKDQNYNNNKWMGTQEEMYVKNTQMSPKKQRPEATGNGPATPGSTTGTGAWGIVKTSQSNSTTASASLGVGASTSFGKNTVSNDHRDINGDRYPDLIDANSFRYTNNKGAFQTSVITPGYEQRSNATSINVSAGGTLPKINFTNNNSNGDTSNQDATNGNSNTSFSASGTITNDNSTESLMDINGDGLVDKVEDGGNVKLNLGTTSLGFESNTSWGFGNVNTGSSTTGSLGGGVSLFNNSLSVGANIAFSNSSDSDSFADVNGDGLIDKIEGSSVRFNLGTGFGSSVSISGFSGLRQSVSLSGGVGATFTICMYFLVPFVFSGPKFCACAEGNGGYGINGEKLQFSDVNGDGFADLVSSESESELKVRYSKIGRTNMLKTVHRPLGASITIDYSVNNPINGSKIGNTYKMPFSKWAMTSVIINDGHSGDGEDNIVSKFEYFEGLQDRRERTFLGFGIVKSHNMTSSNTVYRTAVSEYATANIADSDLYVGSLDNRIRQFFYKKGLITKTYMLDGLGRKHSETVNTYKYYVPGQPTPTSTILDYNTTLTAVIPNPTATFNASSFTDNSRVLPLLVATNSKSWEFDSETAGASSHMKQQFNTIDLYDKYGNIKQYQDKGANLSDISDDIRVNMLYFYNSNNVVNVPMEHRITNQGVVFRLSRNFIDGLGRVNQIRKYLTTSLVANYALYDINYDSFGNILKIMHPKGALSDPNSQRMSYTYTYDAITKTYITNIVDAFGYTSSTSYNYAFGNPTTATDSNNQIVEYKYDSFGRNTEVKGPYEAVWTIKNNYYPNNTIPVATTSHYDNGGEIYTSTFIDGLQRVVQTKKEMQNCNCGANNVGYRFSVSGKVYFDEFGRISNSYLNQDDANCGGSIQEALLQFINLTDIPDQKSETLYDYLDRPLSKTIFGTSAGDATTIFNYSFGSDRDGLTQFMKEIILPNGNTSQSFTDSKGRVTSFNQIGNGETYWTSFEYNKLNELINVKDANEAYTYYTYDNFGRKTSINHPDSGMSKFTYDLASRLRESTNANLISVGQKIIYKYELTHLTDIIYPSHTVIYKYGIAGLTDNSVGRLIYQSDLTGEQYFTYGKLGEIIANKRAVIDPLGSTRVFNSKFDYDTWGRIKRMVYPDGEEIKYGYDNGGLLTHIENTEGQVYLENVCYDALEKRTHVEYGNQTVTNYFYQSQQALNQMEVSTPAGALFMSNKYEYDLNSNVIAISNSASSVSLNNLGGTETKTFQYDDFNRLSHSEGSWFGASEDQIFSLDMQYNSLHNILSKMQTHQTAPSGTSSFVDTPNTMNNFYSYTGGNQPHAVSSIDVFDTNGNQTEQINNTYDFNGNLKLVSHDNLDTGTSTTRQMFWDEQNRLQAIVENGAAHHYVYDASGERILKSSGSSADLIINGEQVTGLNNPGSYTMYPSGYLVVGTQDFTKHYYAGSQRIASRKGNLQDVGNFEIPLFRETSVPSKEELEKKSEFDAKKIVLQKQLSSIFEKAKLGRVVFNNSVAATPLDTTQASCEQEYNALLQYWFSQLPGNTPLEQQEIEDCIKYIDNALDNIFNGDYCATMAYIIERVKCYVPTGEQLPIWWYHPDHLGSSSYLTDYTGTPSHYYNYLPFGEEMVAQNTSSYNNVYRFSGKELDEETGLSYFGARYYDPKWSIWYSVDPEFSISPNFSPYNYCFQNPFTMIDPDGKYAVSVHYRITVNAMLKFGYSSEDSRRIAHMSSMYADHPDKTALNLNNVGKLGSMHYRDDIDYSPTAASQDEKNSHWHSMMSNSEKSSGMLHSYAMKRGLRFGWNNIFAQQKGLDEGKLGQGLHALQDAYAHEGASTDEHLAWKKKWSADKMLINDMYGDTSKAELITYSAVVVMSLFNKDNNGANLKDGMQLDFSGMSKKQLSKVSDLFYDNGFILESTKQKGHYKLKQNF